MRTIGFVGTGTLTEAVVSGLMQTQAARAADEHVSVRLSPRSEAISRRLAETYPEVTRCESNEDVVAGADVVVLAVLPPQLEEVVQGLPFRPEQIVVSLIAGAPVERVKALVAPAQTVVRAIPMPPIRFRKGPIVLYPANPVVEEVFTGLGDLVVVERESDLAALSHASAMMSSHFELQNTVIDWLKGRDLPQEIASAYVRSLFAGLAEIGVDAHRQGEMVDPSHHETRGGLNECGRAYLKRAGVFDEIRRSLDAIAAHVLAPKKD